MHMRCLVWIAKFRAALVSRITEGAGGAWEALVTYFLDNLEFLLAIQKLRADSVLHDCAAAWRWTPAEQASVI